MLQVAGESADQLVEGFGGAPVFFFLVGRQVHRDDWDRQVQRAGEAAGIVLDQFGGAGRADQQGLRLETLIGFAGGILEQFGGIAAEVARLECRVGDGRALRLALDHGEEQIGVCITLGCVQDVVQAVHAGGDSHGPDMRWAFVCPECQLHCATPPASCVGRGDGRIIRPDRRIGRTLEPE
jgi:hypothetical protein